jgi:sugar-specific transcriptional regulator TrmB
MSNNISLLGLNNYEFRVYSTLMEFGTSSASTLAKKSNVPFGRVYDILNSLEMKGLVRIIPEKTKKFMATSPENFIDLINKGVSELNKLKEDFTNLKNKHEKINSEVIEVGRGIHSFIDIVKKRPEPKKTLFTFRDDARYNPHWEASIKKNRKEGVKTLGLIDRNSDSLENIKKIKKIYPNLKHFDNDGAGFQVVDEDFVILNLRKSDTVLMIKDESFAKLMKKLFLLAYKNSEEL